MMQELKGVKKWQPDAKKCDFFWSLPW